MGMSGFKGDNLNKVSENMPWYKGWSVKVKKEKVTGHTLIDALEKVVKPPKRNNKKAFRMPVSGVYKIKGVGDVITGRVEQGAITPGANVRFYPTGSLLSRHSDTHLEVKPYSCTQCGKGFTRKTHFNKHKCAEKMADPSRILRTTRTPKRTVPRQQNEMRMQSQPINNSNMMRATITDLPPSI